MHVSSHVPAARLTSTSNCRRHWMNFSTVPHGRFFFKSHPAKFFLLDPSGTLLWFKKKERKKRIALDTIALYLLVLVLFVYSVIMRFLFRHNALLRDRGHMAEDTSKWVICEAYARRILCAATIWGGYFAHWEQNSPPKQICNFSF